MKKSILAIGLLSLVMILTSFTTPESKINVTATTTVDHVGQGAVGRSWRLDHVGQGAVGRSWRYDHVGQGAVGRSWRYDY